MSTRSLVMSSRLCRSARAHVVGCGVLTPAIRRRADKPSSCGVVGTALTDSRAPVGLLLPGRGRPVVAPLAMRAVRGVQAPHGAVPDPHTLGPRHGASYATVRLPLRTSAVTVMRADPNVDHHHGHCGRVGSARTQGGGRVGIAPSIEDTVTGLGCGHSRRRKHAQPCHGAWKWSA